MNEKTFFKIETERLILSPVVLEDAEEMFMYCNEPTVGKNAGWKTHQNVDETKEIIRTVFLGEDTVFGIRLKESGRLVGSVGIIGDPRFPNDPSVGFLGYASSETVWGRGFMTEAARAVLKFGFEVRGLQRVTAASYADNHRSRRVLEKCGMICEGPLDEKEEDQDGDAHEVLSFSLSKEGFIPDAS